MCLSVSRETVCCVNCGPRGHLSDLGIGVVNASSELQGLYHQKEGVWNS